MTPRATLPTMSRSVNLPGVLDLFVDLALLPSPSGHERSVSDRVDRYVRALGIEPIEDDVGPRIGSDSGNILIRLEPTNAASMAGVPIFFCAHLDTVPAQGPIEPFVADGVIRNAGATILGVDNKAAVAVMLESVRRIVTQKRPHAGVELLLTVMEETGHHGAKAFDVASLAGRVGFTYDYAGEIGDVVFAAPSKRIFTAVFHGRSAHAGMEPQAGRSAILAAARAIADLPVGQVDAETTANVGTITGGSAHNVVPDTCTVVGEIRSHDRTKLRKLLDDARTCLEQGAALEGCTVEVFVDDTYDSYRFTVADQVVGLAYAALRQTAVEPREVVTCGGGDASSLNARGLACLNLGNGMSQPHTADEHISVADLDRMIDVTLAAVDAAREMPIGG